MAYGLDNVGPEALKEGKYEYTKAEKKQDKQALKELKKQEKQIDVFHKKMEKMQSAIKKSRNLKQNLSDVQGDIRELKADLKTLPKKGK